MLNQYIDKMQREVHLGIWNLINVVQLYLCGLRYHSPVYWNMRVGNYSQVTVHPLIHRPLKVNIYIYIYIYGL